MHWYNIRTYLEKEDFGTAKVWLSCAHRDLPEIAFSRLVQTIHEWMLHGICDERILQLLSKVDPTGDSERRSQANDPLYIASVIKRAAEEQVRLRNLQFEKDRLAQIERDRVDKIQRQKENVAREERNRINAIHQQAEKVAREERENALALEQQEKDQQHQRDEALRKIQEARKNAYLESVKLHLEFDFLGADGHFTDLAEYSVSRHEFEEVKTSFVHAWFSGNTVPRIDGKPQLPDNEQASAIAAVNGHVQVVARAGSGKTSTLVNRTHFLLNHCGVASSQLLLLAFNRKAVSEIRRRLLGIFSTGAESEIVEEIARRRLARGGRYGIAGDDIESVAVDTIATKKNISLPHVMTFHALAYSIVHPEENILFNGSEGEAQGLSRVFQNVVDDHLQLPEFSQKIRELMLAHFREDWDRIVDGGYDQSKDELLRFRRSLPREGLGGEYVKSFGEKVISDFLFEHDIAYKYERNHWWSGVNYRPDFTLFKTAKSGVIIEYFGLQGDADYDEMSADKRKYWAEKIDWTLLSFAPVDITANGLDAFRLQLQTRIQECGIQCVRLSEDEIWHRVRERAIDRFTIAVVGFIGRCRKLSWSPSDLQSHIDAYVSQSPVETKFLELAHRLYAAYLDRLLATGEDDFDGLMQRAAGTINSGTTHFQRKSGGGDLKDLRYICVDEFQDFSDLFFRVLSAIREQNPNVELFCVGDDWQAINGFAGSDLRFFQDFQKYIGTSQQLYISTNYRSSKAIVEIGNALMQGLGQPAKAHKEADGRVMLSDLNLFEPTLLEKQRHPGDSITPAVLRVANQSLADGFDVVMLCRRNGLPYFVNYGEGIGVEGRGVDRFLNHVRSFFLKELRGRVTISTAHKYKGLEKSVVIVLDAVGRSYPLIHPDWVFSRIFGESPSKITAEERRLLYVALTRAIGTLVILTQGHCKSPFLEEIERRLPMKSLNWFEFSPVTALVNRRVVVKVKDQERRQYNAGTYAVKDQLHAARYNWHAVKKVWEKSFAEADFTLKSIRKEIWASSADGVDVNIVNDADVEIASYKVDLGVWRCQHDNLAIDREDC